MRKHKDIRKPITVSIPLSIIGQMGELTQPTERSKFVTEALRSYIAQCQANEKAKQELKYQPPLPYKRVTQ